MAVIGRLLGGVAWVLLITLGAGMATGLGLAWRLSQGPIDVTFVVRRAVLSASLPVDVRMARATLQWRAADDDGTAPIELAIETPSIVDDAGRTLDRLDRVAVALSPGALVQGAVEPLSIAASGGSLTLRRTPDGAFLFADRFDVGRLIAGAPGPGFHPPPALPRLRTPAFPRLRTLHLSNLDVTVHGLPGGVPVDWGVEHAGAILERREPGDAPTGRIDATLFVGDTRTRLQARLRPVSGGDVTVDADTSAVIPSRLASLVPALAAVDAPVGLHLTARLDPGMRAVSTRIEATLGAGRLRYDGAIATIDGGAAHLDLRPAPDADPMSGPPPAHPPDASWARAAFGVSLALRPSPSPVQAGPGGGVATLSIAGQLAGDPRRGGHVGGRVAIGLPAWPFPALGSIWPVHAAPGARIWITQNMPVGTLRDLAIDADLASDDGLGAIGLAAISGGFSGEALAIHWLRPVPPVTGGRATLRFAGLDELGITLAEGHQGRLDMAGTTMWISGLDLPDQLADIDAHVSGRLPDVVSLLAEKRLQLLARHPFPFTDPQGLVVARVGVRLPLDARVTMDRIALSAHATMTDVHLGDVALGHGIDDAKLALDATGDGLALHGAAEFAGLPVDFAAAFDFRAGPPAGIDETAVLSTTAPAAGLAQLGVDLGGFVSGPVALAARFGHARSGRETLDVDADLGASAIETPIGWAKARGLPASAHVSLGLQGDRLADISALRATAPGLDVAGRAIVADGGVTALVIERAAVGATRASGRLEFPGAADRRWRLALAGSVLDLRPVLSRVSHPATAVPTGPDVAGAGDPALVAGPAWASSFRFAQVRLGADTALDAVTAHLAGQGGRVASADIVSPAPSSLSARLRPSGEGGLGDRRLTVRSDDAGRALAGLDVTRRVRGGSLAVDAVLADRARNPGAPFATGTMALAGFSIDHAPVVARLLRDATLYGLADPAPLAGITVSRLVVPFTWRTGVIGIRHALMSQPALGLTAQGRIDTVGNTLAIHGTIVPAFAINRLPGRIPLVGRLFSPEQNGGLFALTYSLGGTLDDPTVHVDPLAAIMPGMLRGLLHPWRNY